MSRREIAHAMLMAQRTHRGQKYNDKPYINHVLQVVRRVRTVTSNEHAIIVAYLHDIVEDGRQPRDKILISIGTVFGPEVQQAVDDISRYPDSESYEDYIIRVSGNTLSTIVKLADIDHHLSTILEGTAPPEKMGLQARYEKARAYLEPRAIALA